VTYRRVTTDEIDCVGGVNRREFLTLRTSGTKQILELSCEPLYMRYVDARSGIGALGDSGDSEPDADFRPGEPPTEVDLPTTGQLFGELERQLAEADELRVFGRDWLSGGAFGREVEARVEAFRRRGGRVEFGDEVARQ